MFAKLLQKQNQKYFIEAIDTFFALSLEKKKKQSDAQLLFQFDQSDLIEGSNEQLNVKFCEDLLKDDCSFSTEGTSSEVESIGSKDKDKTRQMSIKGFIVYSEESIQKQKDEYVSNILHQLNLMRKVTMIYYHNMHNNNSNLSRLKSNVFSSSFNVKNNDKVFNQ